MSSSRDSVIIDEIARFLRGHTGLRLGSIRDVENGLRRSMSRADIVDPREYLRRLEDGSLDAQDLIAELTVGETYFFRDPAQFEFIRSTILDDIRSRRGDNHILRIWSAACSTGEEAYSLAMLAKQQGILQRCHILGTDISEHFLNKARDANYRSWSVRGEMPRDMRGMITQEKDHISVRRDIRRRVVFQYLNLAKDPYPSVITEIWGMDLILCRNVLIYFDMETVKAVAQRLYDSLADGGWLLTSASDPLLRDFADFHTLTTPFGVVYQRRPSETPSVSSSVSSIVQDMRRRSEMRSVSFRPAVSPPTAKPVISLGKVLRDARNGDAKRGLLEGRSRDEAPHGTCRSLHYPCQGTG